MLQQLSWLPVRELGMPWKKAVRIWALPPVLASIMEQFQKQGVWQGCTEGTVMSFVTSPHQAQLVLVPALCFLLHYSITRSYVTAVGRPLTDRPILYLVTPLTISCGRVMFTGTALQQSQNAKDSMQDHSPVQLSYQGRLGWARHREGECGWVQSGMG